MSDKNLPSLAPRTFEDALRFSEMLAKSNFIPKAFQNQPGDILAAIQMGYEVGLSPMAALSGIAVINGRPCMYGDALLAIVQASGLLESIDETDDGTTATCTVKRKGDPAPRVAKFSMQNAQRAGLANKQGPWTQYPDRMRQMRARGFALRDKFADVLKGLITREEAIDIIPPKDNPSELSEAETPRARVPAFIYKNRDVKLEHDSPQPPSGAATAPDHIDVEADGSKEAEEGAPLEPDFYHQPGAPVADGDYPTAAEVMDVYNKAPFPLAERLARAKGAVLEWKSIAALTPEERKAVVDALKR